MATITPWAEIVRLITNGEAVDASVTNRPTQDVAQRTQYLKDLIATLMSGQVIIHQSAPLQSGLVVGTTVYLDSGNTYTAALATSTGNNPNPSAYAVGMVMSVATATSGTVALLGRFSLTLPQWAAVIDTGIFAAGQYYLSATQPGKISTTKSGMSVYVGQLLSDGTFIVAPRQPAYTEHSHAAVTLSASPAGTVVDPAPGGLQVVTTPNPALQGWLPATATYFPGWTVGVQIPTNAKFGYNMQHASEGVLRGLFPPVPVEAANAIQSGVVITPFPLLINSYGLWWMDNTYGEAPWPVDYSISLTAPAIQLWVTRASGTTAAPVVSSLQKHPDSVVDIEVLDASDQPATYGALRLRIAALLTAGITTDNGALAVKSITANTFTTGPVAARVKAGANVTITATDGDGTAGYYGTITIAASGSGSLAGAGVLSSLGAATNSTVNDFKLVTMGYGTVSAPVWELDISDTAPSTSTLTPIVWLYAATTGTLSSALTVQTKVITPLVGGVLAATPAWSTAVAVSTAGVTAGTVYKLSLPTVATVPQGSKCLVRLNRSDVDTYTGAISVMKLAFTLT